MERPRIQASVVFLQDEDGRLCLARKKQPIHHDGGAIEYSLGLYNGYGGKMEDADEDIFDTAVRELYDESGVDVEWSDLSIMSRVYFYITKDEVTTPFMTVSFFFVSAWGGEPKEGDEMGPPTFFAPSDIPYDAMMPADKILVSKMLEGKPFVAEVYLKGKGVEPDVVYINEALS